MPLKDTISVNIYIPLILFSLLFSACNITRKAPADRPYLVDNTIDVKGGSFTKIERGALEDRLQNQLDDSSILQRTDVLLLFHVLKRPPAYDTAYSELSKRNMKASMFHLGYYNSDVSYKADTSGRRVTVNYQVDVGNATRIDTFAYRLADSNLQRLATKDLDKSILVKNNPITKAAVLGEKARVVDSFRNNGYYKFSAAELLMRGDTTIEALTNVSDDPFEQLRLLAEAQQKRDSPDIRLAMVLNVPEDTTRLNRYYINNIYVLMDYQPGDDITDTTNIQQVHSRNFFLRFHERLFRNSFLARNITVRPGQLYSQSEYNKTLNNLSKAGVWQSVNIQMREVPDTNLLDMIIEAIPSYKFNFEASAEASYASTSNTNNALGGNLIGFSGNLALTNKNIHREAIRMTHRLRAGIELNNNSRGSNIGAINSNELSYSNTVVFPKLIDFWPFDNNLQDTRGRNFGRKPGESFINTFLSLNNRLQLFSLQTFSLNAGITKPIWTNNSVLTQTLTLKPFNVEFNYLYNLSDSFNKIRDNNPFLRYAYNTSFVLGTALSYTNVYRNPRHLHSLSKERSIKFNLEESGYSPLNWIPGLSRYKAHYLKPDIEYKYTVTYKKTAIALRSFVGVGIPLSSDTSLPFFKQYFGGGTSSMRGWPVRGIGRGGQPLAPYKQNIFNDRTGDIQLELNAEYRYDIARLIPNILTLKGALFVDIGNVWNMRSSKPPGQEDSAQFKFKNLYKQLGVSAGTGFRLDFNYLILRFDFGFRFKRPELSYYENSGWKAPPIGFNDFLQKLFTRGKDDEYRKWRYENFNFTIGISYPF